jgi:hypothetical protein
MTLTASPVPAVDSKVAAVDPKAARRRCKKARARRSSVPARRAVLGRYVAEGRLREVLTQPGAAGSLLVVDRDVATDGDLRLVAHLGAEEPPGNAALACRDYLRYPSHRWCRRLTAEDLVVAPFGERPVQRHAAVRGAEPFGLVEDRHAAAGQEAGETPAEMDSPAPLCDRHGCTYRLGPADTGMSIPQLRWHRLSPAGCSGAREPVGVRDVVGSLESYEPVRTLTVRALDRHRGDPRVSTYTLGAELERLDASRIVLNRGLREAVEAAIASGAVSMSEITVRCGRLKRGSGGAAAGGDTSWLARRVGLMPEGGRHGQPTPWVHSEVLALIARRGLGISPREVELG